MNADIYTGKTDLDQQLEKQLGVTGCLVARISKLLENRGHCIYTDRFYSSVNIAEYLQEKQGTMLCGTTMPKRKRFPKELIETNKMERGTHKLLYNRKVAADVWCDKTPIYFISTKFIADSDVTVLRYNRIEKNRVEDPCPALVKAYNAYMGGTDKKDQMTKLQKCRRHYKCPRRLMIKFFVWCSYNAYIMMNYYSPHKVVGKRFQTFHMFIDKLCHEMIG